MDDENIELEIERIAFRGAGVAHAGPVVCFVPGTCPGERVRARVVRRRKNFWEARVEKVLEASPDRLPAPDCRVFTPDGEVQTPGCVYDHATHEAELRWKGGQLRDFLVRQARIAEPFLEPAVASPRHLNYRNKAVMHVARDARGRRVLGYVGDDNATVLDQPRCPLSLDPINDALAEIRADGAFWRFARPGSRLALRHTTRDGVSVSVRLPDGRFEPADPPPLTETVPVAGALEVPARGFFQTNPDVGAALVGAVAGEIRAAAPARFLDLYCGVGVFGLVAAALGVPRVAGAESGRDAAAAARRNAGRLGFADRASFACADAARALPGLLAGGPAAGTLALVDPPRAGLAPEAVRALLAAPPARLLYVSCSPDTLARDLALLCAPGAGAFRLEKARLFDMFPRTAHFETLCVLSAATA